MNLKNLHIYDESIYSPDDKFIQIRHISYWSLTEADWIYQNENGHVSQHDICYVERKPYGDTFEYIQTPIRFEDIPQYVLDYLYSHGYKHI